MARKLAAATDLAGSVTLKLRIAVSERTKPRVGLGAGLKSAAQG